MDSEELFRRYAPFVGRFLYRLGVSESDIDDMLQEVFLVAHRSGGYRPGAATPTTFLGSIAIRATANYRRRELRNHSLRSDSYDLSAFTSTEPTPVQVLESNEALVQLQQALDTLKPDMRAVLILSDIEGESAVAIAAALDIPLGTTYWRLNEARKRFQKAVRGNKRRDGTTQPVLNEQGCRL